MMTYLEIMQSAFVDELEKISGATAEGEHGIHNMTDRPRKGISAHPGIATAVGAVLGAGAGALAGGPNHRLSGAVAGGAAGAGLYLRHRQALIQRIQRLQDDADRREKISRADPALLKVAAQLSDGNILKTYSDLAHHPGNPANAAK
jgi:hypothetical protein